MDLVLLVIKLPRAPVLRPLGVSQPAVIDADTRLPREEREDAGASTRAPLGARHPLPSHVRRF